MPYRAPEPSNNVNILRTASQLVTTSGEIMGQQTWNTTHQL